MSVESRWDDTRETEIEAFSFADGMEIDFVFVFLENI